MLADLLFIYLILEYLENIFFDSINIAGLISIHEKSLLAIAAITLQFLQAKTRNCSKSKIKKSINFFLWYFCPHASYCLQIIIFAIKKTKIIKDILDKKVSITGIAATNIVDKPYSMLYLPFIKLIVYLLLVDLLLAYLQLLPLPYNFYKQKIENLSRYKSKRVDLQLLSLRLDFYEQKSKNQYTCYFS